MFGQSFRFGKEQRLPLVWEGAVFRHCGHDSRIETALVVKLIQDADHPEPQVQFIVEIERANRGRLEKDVRTLKLLDFYKRYGEPIV